jgi:hypothetical protein
VNFNLKYPESTAVRFETTPNVIMNRMEATGRVYPCTVCGKATQWVRLCEDQDGKYTAHICSEECVAEFGDDVPCYFGPIAPPKTEGTPREEESTVLAAPPDVLSPALAVSSPVNPTETVESNPAEERHEN